MAIKNKNSGFALLMAVIFMSVMLAFALLIGSLAYKQSILSGAALESQTAFYAADAALECALFADQKDPSGLSPFAYRSTNNGSAPQFKCGNADPVTSRSFNSGSGATAATVYSYQFPLDYVNGSPTHCADIEIYKYASPQGTAPYTIIAYIFSRGYSTSCDNLDNAGHYAARGIRTKY